MAKTYRLAVENADGVSLADADGDIDVVAYVNRKLRLDEATGSFKASLEETDGISGQETRNILSMTADAEVVAFYLKRKITAERKAEKPAEAENTREVAGAVDQELQPVA